MNLDVLALMGLVLAAFPAGLFLLNSLVYRRLKENQSPLPVSVLIPARNEEHNIRATLAAVLANRGLDFEVIVLDDHSTDRTAEIVSQMARNDQRLRLESAPPLPPGWCGKQHACYVLAQRARHPLLVFIDADVRLSTDALARLATLMNSHSIDLASGVPRQELGTFSERLLIPLIHFILLGFLPMHIMRWSKWAAFSAGCGQLFIVRRAAYLKCGGHAQIRTSLHDGITLPRVFRRLGFRTDLFDATDLATCRMYATNAQVWSGLAKNATEGLAAPASIGPMTGILLGGQVLPFVMLALAPWLSEKGMQCTTVAVGLACLPRVWAALRYQQPLGSVFLHPLGILALLGIQWVALAKSVAGLPAVWKGRAYGGTSCSASGGLTLRISRWKLVWVLLSMIGFLAPTLGTETNLTNAQILAPFSLKDQYGTLHSISFPRTNLTVLTVADRAGSVQVDSWIIPLKKHYGQRITIIGVADVDKIARPFRGLVRARFKKEWSYPLLLDWEGEISKSLGCGKNQVNLFAIHTNGVILWHGSGFANEGTLKSLFSIMNLALGPKN